MGIDNATERLEKFLAGFGRNASRSREPGKSPPRTGGRFLLAIVDIFAAAAQLGLGSRLLEAIHHIREHFRPGYRGTVAAALCLVATAALADVLVRGKDSVPGRIVERLSPSPAGQSYLECIQREIDSHKCGKN